MVFWLVLRCLLIINGLHKRWIRASFHCDVYFNVFSLSQGIYWALACTWMIYHDRGDNVKIPHMKGEPYTGNSSYEPLYTNYIPTEFLISGIVSGLLTVVNVICIFITAIIVLKIKEVAAPYTSSPDLRR